MSSNQDPSLISGHAQYAKGAAVETVGSVTGSQEWKDSGASSKNAGLDEMREAGKTRSNDNQSHGFGKVEEVAGKAVGCDGMEQEGSATKKSE